MPYNGVPKSKTKAMDRCIKQVMSSDPSKTKSQAVAICHSSIMGKESKKGEFMKNKYPQNVTINFNGYWDDITNSTGDDSTSITDVIKADDEDAAKFTKKTNTKKGGVDKSMAKDEKEKKLDKEKDEVVVEKKEVKDTEKEELKKDAVEADKPVTDGDDAEEEVEEAKKADDEEKEKPAEPENAAEVSKMLQSLLEKVDNLQEQLNKADDEDSADADDAAEEAPEEDEAPEKEEVASKKDDDSPGEAEQMAKVEDTLSKVNDTIQKFSEQFESFEKRIKQLEDQPMPSKVASPVVVAKSDYAKSDSTVREVEARIEEIDAQLKKYAETRESNITEYQHRNLGDKAFQLISEKSRLKTMLS